MDKVIYLAMSGAGQMMLGQSVHTNNLANATTPGFRSDLSHYTTIGIEGDGLDTRDFTLTNDVVSDFTHGTLEQTGRDLDLALYGEGWMSVQSPDGREAYTRNGHLNITPEGMLVTHNNLSVMGEGGPIVLPPAEKVNIANDGTVSVRPLGGENDVVIDRIKLVKPENTLMAKYHDGLFYTRDGSQLEPDASVRVRRGYVETSNVNVVSEMVSMIDLARQFEVQIKLMNTAEENDRVASDIAKIS